MQKAPEGTCCSDATLLTTNDNKNNDQRQQGAGGVCNDVWLPTATSALSVSSLASPAGRAVQCFALTECQRLSTVTNWNPDYMTILITSSSCIPRQTPRSHQDSSAIPCQATTPLSPRLARAGNIDGEGGGAPMGARAGVGTLVPTRKKVIRSVKQRIALRPCH